jgi:hypothetical protein
MSETWFTGNPTCEGNNRVLVVGADYVQKETGWRFALHVEVDPGKTVQESCAILQTLKGEGETNFDFIALQIIGTIEEWILQYNANRLLRIQCCLLNANRFGLPVHVCCPEQLLNYLGWSENALTEIKESSESSGVLWGLNIEPLNEVQ